MLGEALIDATGQHHQMLGLLPLVTSFADRKLHLGYRTLVLSGATALGPVGTVLRGHEFHYASTIKADGTPLGNMATAIGDDLGSAGLMKGSVFGSFFHLICQ